jgi:nucleolar protein 4
MPCLPEHLLSLQQDGCTGEVGLLEFESSDEAQRVVSMLHKRTSLAGCEGICLWARQLGGEGAQVRRWRLIIRNVAFSASEQVLRRLFSTAGFVWDLHIPIGENGSMRGFAFVAYTARARELRAVSTVHLCVLIRPSQTPSEQLKC